MTKEDVLAELVQLAYDYPEKNITRAFYRKETANPDSVWELHWGNWTNFMVAAGQARTKTQKQLYSQVAAHVSTDHLESITLEKLSYSGKYEKPSGKRFITVLAGSDIHGHLCDPFWRRIFIDTAARLKPDHIALVGDVLDLPNFSKYNQDPRTYDVLGEIKWTHQFLADLREAAGDVQLDLLEGNHSARLVKYLAESAPHLMPLLSDLHGMGVSELLGLDKYQVNYIAKANLAVFKETDLKKEIAKNYTVVADTVLFHHFPQAKNWGLDCQTGHHHTLKVDTFWNVTTGPTTWVQAGCGHVRNASYSMGEKWSNGFCIWHIDTLKKLATPEIIDVTNDLAVVGGKYYFRTEDEIVK
jgi:hypothetical protein